MPPTHLPDTYDRSKETLDKLFSYPENFGIVRREMTVGGQRAVLYYAEALCDTAVTERVLAFCKESADPGHSRGLLRLLHFLCGNGAFRRSDCPACRSDDRMRASAAVALSDTRNSHQAEKHSVPFTAGTGA